MKSGHVYNSRNNGIKSAKHQTRTDKEEGKMILFIIYMIASWWAINVVWYDRHIAIFSSGMYFYMQKFIIALFFGWAAIPIAIIMKLLHI